MSEKTIQKKCQTCGKLFNVKLREIKRGNGKYCSLSCAAKAVKTLQYIQICKHCGREFMSAKLNARYCSNPCKQKNYRERLKKTITDSSSMKSFYKIFKGIPCELCGWNNSSKDLHHIVEVSKGGTNTIDNLINVCPNCHREIHNNLISKTDILNAVKIRTISSS